MVRTPVPVHVETVLSPWKVDAYRSSVVSESDSSCMVLNMWRELLTSRRQLLALSWETTRDGDEPRHTGMLRPTRVSEAILARLPPNGGDPRRGGAGRKVPCQWTGCCPPRRRATCST